MTFQQLAYLIEVSKCGSVSAAAQKLYVSQSTISISINALEKEAGQSLFIRDGRGLQLTPRGEQVLVHAKRIMESRDLIAAQTGLKKRSVKIGCIQYTPAENAFLRLLDEIPDISQFSLGLCDSRIGNFLDGLISCELDMAIFFVVSTAREQKEKAFEKYGLDYEILTTIPIAVCIGPGHPLYAEECVDIKDLGNTPLLDAPDRSVSGTGAFQGHLSVHPSKSIIASGHKARRGILNKGLAYTITHMRSQKDQAETGLRYIPLNNMNYIIYSVMDKSRPNAPEVYRYLELLKEEVAAYSC